VNQKFGYGCLHGGRPRGAVALTEDERAALLM
jgi:hypothetical protein